MLGMTGYQLWFSGERYATPVGGISSIPLADGSHVTLNTNSKIRVSLSETERHIDLSQGEAFFDVAHDAARPFVVQAGTKRVIAVGTQFSVRREGAAVEVVVTSGKVRVDSSERARVAEAPAIRQATDAGRGVAEALLSGGGIARAQDTGIVVQNRTPQEAEEALSWRSGYIVFEDTSLADAVAELNRYNARQLVIDDPAIAAMKLTGKFGATNGEAFVSLLERSFHIRARSTANEILLTAAAAR